MEQTLLDIHPTLQPHIIKALMFEQDKGLESMFRYVPRIFPAFLFILKDTHQIDSFHSLEIFPLKPASIYYMGVSCKPASITCSSNIQVIVVLLHPYSASFFFGDDAHYYSDIRFEISDTTPDWRQLNEQINNRNSLQKKWQLIQDFFTKRFTHDFGYTFNYVSHAIQYMHYQKGIVGIDEVAKQVCTSPRNLLDIFKHYIGMSPKKIADAMRFNTFVNSFQQESRSLLEAASAHGYYDLSHLHKDFLRYMAVSPADFLTMAKVPKSNLHGNWEEADYLS